MSHLQGTDYVGSMVVMEDGLPKPAEYRRFKVRNVPGNDDYAAMEEVLTRRLTAYLTEKELPVAERKRHFSYPPQLLLVDGGKGPAQRGRAGPGRSSTWKRRSRWLRWPSSSRRSTCPGRPTRSGCPAARRRSTCCNGCGTKPTGSPFPTIASCGASA